MVEGSLGSRLAEAEDEANGKLLGLKGEAASLARDRQNR
jgi:hypothetical protein